MGGKINEKGRKYEESREWKDKDNIEDRKWIYFIYLSI